MTAKEKAEELVERYYKEIKFIDRAKQCALIAVEEALNFTINNCCEHQNRKFWQEVKTEIEKL